MNVGGVFSWYRGQRLDEELFGGHQALLTEGLPPSMGLFMVGIAAYVLTAGMDVTTVSSCGRAGLLTTAAATMF